MQVPEILGNSNRNPEFLGSDRIREILKLIGIFSGYNTQVFRVPEVIQEPDLFRIYILQSPKFFRHLK